MTVVQFFAFVPYVSSNELSAVQYEVQRYGDRENPHRPVLPAFVFCRASPRPSSLGLQRSNADFLAALSLIFFYFTSSRDVSDVRLACGGIGKSRHGQFVS
jgi:hypothetical protein